MPLHDMLGALDLVGIAAVLADRHGTLHHFNRRAEDLVPDLLTLGHALEAEQARAIGDLVARTIAGPTDLAACAPVTLHLNGGRLLIVQAAMAGSTEASHLAEGCAVLMVVCPSKPHELSVPVLQAAFGLTKSEILLARYLWLGKSLKEIARIREMSVATLRVQLRGLFTKTRTKRQVELVGLLARLPPACGEATRARFRPGASVPSP